MIFKKNRYIGKRAKSLISGIEHGTRKGAALLFWVGAGFACVILVVTAIDVIGRYFFDKPLRGALEICVLAAVAMVSLTLAHTQARKGHVEADILYVRFPRWIRSKLDVVSSFLALVVAGVLGYQAILVALHIWRVEPIPPITTVLPTFPFRLLIAIGALALAIELIRDLLDNFRHIRGH
jgi:TRAP-type C4-dicarboxylate transport system permease small subunit